MCYWAVLMLPNVKATWNWFQFLPKWQSIRLQVRRAYVFLCFVQCFGVDKPSSGTNISTINLNPGSCIWSQRTLLIKRCTAGFKILMEFKDVNWPKIKLFRSGMFRSGKLIHFNTTVQIIMHLFSQIHFLSNRVHQFYLPIMYDTSNLSITSWILCYGVEILKILS